MTQAFYMDIHQSLTKKRLEGSYVTINEVGLRSLALGIQKKENFIFR